MSKTLLVLVAAAGLLIVGTLSYLHAPSAAHPTTSPSTATVAPTATAAPTADAYAGWKTYQSSEFGFSFRYPATWGDASATVHQATSGYALSGYFTQRELIQFHLYTSDWSNGLGGPAYGYYSQSGSSYLYHYPNGTAGPAISPTSTVATTGAGMALVVGSQAALNLDTVLRNESPAPQRVTYAFLNFAGTYKGSPAKGIEFFMQDSQPGDAPLFDQMIASLTVSQ